jgi:hypothetical protein
MKNMILTKVQEKMFRKMNIALVFVLTLVMTGVLSAGTIFASTTSNFKQTINPGTLSVDIVDGSFATVASPSVTLGATAFSWACSSSTGTFGTPTQQIYLTNPSAARNGWTISLAGSAPSALWTSATTSTNFDFNNPASSGCTGGQMRVDPSAGTLAANGSYSTSNISKGSASAFSQGVTDSITLLSASASAAKKGKWTLQGVGVTQIIPAEQDAADDYNIDMVLSVVAN